MVIVIFEKNVGFECQFVSVLHSKAFYNVYHRKQATLQANIHCYFRFISGSAKVLGKLYFPPFTYFMLRSESPGADNNEGHEQDVCVKMYKAKDSNVLIQGRMKVCKSVYLY